jgi:hypothetical protein
MKNQYFGDNRDLFKWDLIRKVAEYNLVNQVIYIPMLTSESYDRKQKPGSDEFKILLDNLVKEKNKRQREQYEVVPKNWTGC